jgi:hypothetical protein
MFLSFHSNTTAQCQLIQRTHHYTCRDSLERWGPGILAKTVTGSSSQDIVHGGVGAVPTWQWQQQRGWRPGGWQQGLTK